MAVQQKDMQQGHRAAIRLTVKMAKVSGMDAAAMLLPRKPPVWHTYPSCARRCELSAAELASTAAIRVYRARDIRVGHIRSSPAACILQGRHLAGAACIRMEIALLFDSSCELRGLEQDATRSCLCCSLGVGKQEVRAQQV